MSLGEELASRMSTMSHHFQSKTLHILQKLNFDKGGNGHLDTSSLISTLDLNSDDAKGIVLRMQTIKGKPWSTKLTELVQDYVVTSSLKFSLQDTSRVLTVMIEKDIATLDVLTALAKTVSSILTLDISVVDRWVVWGPQYVNSIVHLLWGFGKVGFYDEELFSAFATLVLGRPDSHLQTPRFFANLSWSCAKVRYYSEPLMQSIAKHSLPKLAEFTGHDAALLVYSFAMLNYKHYQLLNSALDKILSDPNHLENPKLCWMIAWGAMVLEIYPAKLLSQILTDDYLKSKLTLE